MVSLCDSIALSQLYNNKPALERVKQQLMDTPGSTVGWIHTICLNQIIKKTFSAFTTVDPAFNKTNPYYEGVCMGNRVRATLADSHQSSLHGSLSCSDRKNASVAHRSSLDRCMYTYLFFGCCVCDNCGHQNVDVTDVDSLCVSLWTCLFVGIDMWTAYASACRQVSLSS